MARAWLCTSASASDFPLAQYAHNAWNITEGTLPGGAISITQTTDGYLWVGTEAGLLRFDGVKFTPWTKWPPGYFAAYNIYALLGTKDNDLWVGTSRGLVRLKDGSPLEISGSPGRVNAIAMDKQGTVWFAQTRSVTPLCQVDGTNARCLGRKDGIACITGQSVSTDSKGQVWLGSNPGICERTDGETHYRSSGTPGETESYTAPPVAATIDYGKSQELVGYATTGIHRGLQLLSLDGTWTSFELPGLHGEAIAVSTLMRDVDGDLWIGTTQDGIYHVNRGRVDHFGAVDGLSSDDVNSLYEDHEGNVWVATAEGVDRFHRAKTISFSSKQGLLSNDVLAVTVSSSGSIAAGGANGLQIKSVDEDDWAGAHKFLQGHHIHCLFYDSVGTLWIAAADGVGSIIAGRYRPLAASLSSKEVIRKIVEDGLHHIWFVGIRGIYQVQGDQLVETQIVAKAPPRVVAEAGSGLRIIQPVDPPVHVDIGSTISIANTPAENSWFDVQMEPNGDIWQTGRPGARFWTGKAWRVLDSAGGLPCDTVYSMTADIDAMMWVYQPCGMTVVPYAELTAWAHGVKSKVTPKLLIGRLEGALGNYNDFSSESARSPDGRLWFAHESTLQMIDPRHMIFNAIRPPVHIEAITADHKDYPLTASLKLPARTMDVEIDYAALSFVIPQLVHFRYKMSGIDKDWQDVGTRRQAFYMNLPPGHYKFQVIACNNDALWNLVGDTIQFTIAPAYYQTLWFRALAVVFAICALWLTYLYRLRAATAMLERGLLERFSERERIARELHDTLFQGFQAVVLNCQTNIDILPEDNSARIKMEAVLKRAELILLSARNRIQGLRSKVLQADFSITLESLMASLKVSWNVDVQLVQIGNVPVLKTAVQEELFAITQEALTNAAKHAKAAVIRCDVLYEEKALTIICTDNGIGIPVEVIETGGRVGHFGLIGMQERAKTIGANLVIERSDCRGTVVRLTIEGRKVYSK